MKKAVLVLVLMVAIQAMAQTNTITFTNKAGEAIRDAQVLTVTAADLYYKTPGGGARVHLADLPPEVSAHFGYDPLKVPKVTASPRAASNNAGEDFRTKQLLSQNEDLFECDEESETPTNRSSEPVRRSWQMCLHGTEVYLSYYDDKNTNHMTFPLGRESIVNQAFDKFVEWNGLALTNKAQPFEKLILEFSGAEGIYDLPTVHKFTFRWGLYGGADFYDYGTHEGGFDINSVLRFQLLLKRLPELEGKVLDKIHQREAQKNLFK